MQDRALAIQTTVLDRPYVQFQSFFSNQSLPAQSLHGFGVGRNYRSINAFGGAVAADGRMGDSWTLSGILVDITTLWALLCWKLRVNLCRYIIPSLVSHQQALRTSSMISFVWVTSPYYHVMKSITVRTMQWKNQNPTFQHNPEDIS